MNADRARKIWFNLCDLAEVAPDTQRTAAELVERLRRRQRPPRTWGFTVAEVQRCMDDYEATLDDD